MDEASDADDKRGWRHLRDAFHIYFSTPADKDVRPDILWLDYPFARKEVLVQAAEQDLRNNLFNDPAWSKLAEKLKYVGAFSDRGKDVYFWNTSPYNWSDMSYQSRSVLWYDRNRSLLDNVKALG